MIPRPRARLLGLLIQVALLLALAGLVAWGIGNTLDHLRARGVRAGFDFLMQSAGFEIGETPLRYESSQPFWRAFLVGLVNTLRAALPGIGIATALGMLIGLGRLSRNGLLRALCAIYVEVLRNVPLIVQLLMWYFALSQLLPASNDAWHPMPGLFLSKSGLSFPWPGSGGWEWPEAGEFNVSGGAAVTPEYLSVLLALSLYTAAFIAEIVRAGVQSVPRDQVQAAQSLGLAPRQQLRHVVLPLALRVIVPAMTNQYLNLAKNSSLAVAIGYPDLVSVANTAINQTGRAFECIAVIMAVYLMMSLMTSSLMNRYNARVAMRGTS